MKKFLSLIMLIILTGCNSINADEIGRDSDITELGQEYSHIYPIELSGDVTVYGKLNTNRVGEYTVEYLNGERTEKWVREIQVVDTSAPKLSFSFGDTMYIYENEEFKQPDYSTDELSEYTVDVIGEVGTSLGQYDIDFIARDVYGNESKTSITVERVETVKYDLKEWMIRNYSFGEEFLVARGLQKLYKVPYSSLDDLAKNGFEKFELEDFSKELEQISPVEGTHKILNSFSFNDEMYMSAHVLVSEEQQSYHNIIGKISADNELLWVKDLGFDTTGNIELEMSILPTGIMTAVKANTDDPFERVHRLDFLNNDGETLKTIIVDENVKLDMEAFSFNGKHCVLFGYFDDYANYHIESRLYDNKGEELKRVKLPSEYFLLGKKQNEEMYVIGNKTGNIFLHKIDKRFNEKVIFEVEEPSMYINNMYKTEKGNYVFVGKNGDDLGYIVYNSRGEIIDEDYFRGSKYAALAESVMFSVDEIGFFVPDTSSVKLVTIGFNE